MQEEDLNKFNEKVIMPNLVGENIYKGLNALEDLGLQVEIQGDGDMIFSQYPMPDVEISKNSVVMVGC